MRQKAKDIASLLADEERLKRERTERVGMRNRMGSILPSDAHSRSHYEHDSDIQRAIEESKRTAALEEERRKRR